MASVAEEMLQNIASDIVRDFNSGGVSLTDGVRKKASESGLNRDQTARLIERTNSEAFMSLFPKQTEFKVAHPEEVLGEKVASEQKGTTKSYKAALERDLGDIFGMNTSGMSKVASVDLTPESVASSAVLMREVAALNTYLEECRLAKIAEDMETKVS